MKAHDPLTIHVLPDDDLIEHENSESCVCGPYVEIVDGDMLVLHHSLDNREANEPEE